MKLLVQSKVHGNMDLFAEYLSRLGVKCKTVNDPHLADRSLKRIHMWRQSKQRFDNLVDDFDPDAVICSPGDFGAATLKSDIPLITYLGGNYWQEIDTARRLHYRTFPRNITSKRYEAHMRVLSTRFQVHHNSIQAS